MYVVNVLTAIVCGTLSLTWIWSYTDWVATVTAALGLGGVLSWATVVARIIPQKRFDALSKVVDEKILPSRTAFAVQAVLWVLFFGFLPWSSTAAVFDNSLGRSAARIVIEPLADGGDGARAAGETANSKAALSVVVPVGQKRLVHLPTDLFGSKRYRLRPQGAPDVSIDVTHLKRSTFALPDIFYRDHSLLLYPSVTFWRLAAGGGVTLRIDQVSAICEGAEKPISSKAEKDIEDYRGQSVWLGPGKLDIEPPMQVVDEITQNHLTDAKFQADKTDTRSFSWALRRPRTLPVTECEIGVRKIEGFCLSFLDPGQDEPRCSYRVEPRQSGAPQFQDQVLYFCSEKQRPTTPCPEK